MDRIDPARPAFVQIGIVEDDPDAGGAACAAIADFGLRFAAIPSIDELDRSGLDLRQGCLVLEVSEMDRAAALHTELKSRLSELKTIVVVGRTDVAAAVDAVKRGAIDVLPKPVCVLRLRASLLEALRASALSGRSALDRALLSARRASLTPREVQVVDLLYEGLTNKEIAGRLGVSPQAIDAHRKKAMLKFGVDRVTTLVRRIAECGAAPGSALREAETCR